MKLESIKHSSTAGAGLFADAIGKSFRGRKVVSNVSLRLARGEVAGLLGPNGAGKTTCFYMITGLIGVDYGNIWLDGENITAQPMYQRARMGVGYLPQEASIFRGMTVEENIMAVVEMREPSDKRARLMVTELLEELRIEHLRAAPAVSLSGGERRRVDGRHPRGHHLFEGARHRDPDHRPQCARDPRHHRPRLDHPRRRGAVRGRPRRDPRRPRGPPRLSGRPVQLNHPRPQFAARRGPHPQSSWPDLFGSPMIADRCECSQVVQPPGIARERERSWVPRIPPLRGSSGG
jgi:hypothetical protein